MRFPPSIAAIDAAFHPRAACLGFVAAFVCSLVLTLTGCSTSSAPASGGESGGKTGKSVDATPGTVLSESNKKLARGCLSAVEIYGQSRVTTLETIESVFTGAGLSLLSRSTDKLGFERPSSRGEAARYGSWFGGDMRVRLRVELQQQGANVLFVRCRSFIAREAGTVMEDEQALARRHVREFEGLLGEVAARLN